MIFYILHYNTKYNDKNKFYAKQYENYTQNYLYLRIITLFITQLNFVNKITVLLFLI